MPFNSREDSRRPQKGVRSAGERFFAIPEMVETLAEHIDIISLVVLRRVSKQVLAATRASTYISRRLFFLPGKVDIPGPLPEVEAAEVPLPRGDAQNATQQDEIVQLDPNHPLHEDNRNPALQKIFGSFAVTALSNGSCVLSVGKAPWTRKSCWPSWKSMYVSSMKLTRLRIEPAALWRPGDCETISYTERVRLLESLDQLGLPLPPQYQREFQVGRRHWTHYLATARKELCGAWIWGESLLEFLPGRKPDIAMMEKSLEREEGIQVYQLAREIRASEWNWFIVTCE
jgi:hypothetical protein